MTPVYAAESRMDEIATVTPQRGPELLSVFNQALRVLGEHLADLSYQESLAKRKVRERRAVVVLEVIPTKLAEKKLSNNDTNREAVIDLDPEYAVLSDVQNQIEAAFVLIREKLKSTESAINSTKKSLDMTSNLSNYMPNTQLVTPLQQPQDSFKIQIPDINPTQTPLGTTGSTGTGLVIGKARY
jgi:hypothetical protein